jgi:hypothetical protein
VVRFVLYNYALVLTFGLIVIGFVLASGQPRAMQNSAQNSERVPGYEGTPDRFYALGFDRLQADLERGALPFKSISFGPRQLFASRHIFSPRPVYLEVRYEHFSYFVYAISGPDGLHVSSWLFSKHEAWANRPLLKYLVAWRLTQMTLFQFDIMRLFHEVVEGALGAVIDELREERGLPPLEEFERRPVLNGFYATMQGVAPGTRGALPLASAPQIGMAQSAAPKTRSLSETPTQAVIPQGGTVSPASSPKLPAARRAMVPQAGDPDSGNFESEALAPETGTSIETAPVTMEMPAAGKKPPAETSTSGEVQS